MELQSLPELIAERRLALTPREAILANYVLSHEEEIAFHAAARVARAAGVSEATVVRFACRLGFRSYSALQAHVQESVRARIITTEERLLSAASATDPARACQAALLQDVENLNVTMRQLDGAAFARVVEGIAASRRLVVMGLRGSAGVAAFLGYGLRQLVPGTHVITAHGDDFVDQLLDLDEHDVLLAVVFSRASASAVESLRLARERGASVYLVTDGLGTPGVSWAHEVLVAARQSVSHLASYTAAMALAHGIVAGVGAVRKQEAARRLAQLERFIGEAGLLVMTRRKRSARRRTGQ